MPFSSLRTPDFHREVNSNNLSFHFKVPLPGDWHQRCTYVCLCQHRTGRMRRTCNAPFVIRQNNQVLLDKYACIYPGARHNTRRSASVGHNSYWSTMHPQGRMNFGLAPLPLLASLLILPASPFSVPFTIPTVYHCP
jgi:hypothetical protein